MAIKLHVGRKLDASCESKSELCCMKEWHCCAMHSLTAIFEKFFLLISVLTIEGCKCTWSDKPTFICKGIPLIKSNKGKVNMRSNK